MTHPDAGQPTTTDRPRAERFRLVPLGREHVPPLADIVADPEAVRFTRIPEPPPPGFADNWVARYELGRRNGTQEGFAVLDADGAFAGIGLAPAIERDGRQAELGYMTHPSARGRGAATAALRLLTRWAFEELGLLRVYLLIDVDNLGSQRVAAKAGYRLEGTMRSVHLKQDRRVDTQVWSRLPTDG